MVGEPFEVSDGYVKKISADLQFATEVVIDRCAHTLAYDPQLFSNVYDPHTAVKGLPKVRESSD